MKTSPYYFFLLCLCSFLTINPGDNILQALKTINWGEKAIAQTQTVPELKIINQGKQVMIRGRKVNLAWMQWQEGNKIRTGISDLGAETMLGFELLSTTKSQKQPIRWFNYNKTLNAKFVNPYRYLDISDLIQTTSLQVEAEGNILNLNLPKSQVNKVYESKLYQGKQLVIELDKPSFFQVSQGRDQAVIIVESDSGQQLPNLANFDDPLNNSTIGEDEGDRATGSDSNGSLYSVSKKGNQTLVTVNLPKGNKLKVTSANPSLLLVNFGASIVTPRDISWQEDILMSRQYVRLPNSADAFLVSSLKINPQNYNLDIRPILPNPNTVIGTAPLKTMGQELGILAGINGGFFNRDNRLPLGTIKNKNNWLSSPILNRGVIAWDDLGNFQITRLKLEESITINNRDRFLNNYVNSGYLQQGVARYTPSWGNTYTTLSDQETIVLVENNQVRDKVTVAKAGSKSVRIPFKGYLLVFRKTENIAGKINVNDQVKINSSTYPLEMAKYPYIMGAGPLLLLNNQIVLNGAAENFSAAFNKQKASRSAIAINRQGELLMVAVHNRVGGAGPSLEELARILQQMGAVSALNLDGGSSTQIYLGGEIIDRSVVTAARVNNGIGIFLRKRN